MTEYQNIIENSARMFKIYGIKSVTMDDIATKMGISKKTLYQHISDRNDLIGRVLENEYLTITHQIGGLHAESQNALEQLIKFYLLLIKYLKQISPSAITDLQKQYPQHYQSSKNKFKILIKETLEKLIKQGKTEGLIRLDADEKVISQLHTDKIEQYKASFEKTDESLLNKTFYKEMIDYYLRGLISKQGEPVLHQLLTEFDNYLK